MISVRVGSHHFHYRAGAVVINQEHLLLHRLEGDPFWALPGGRVNAGEQARDAIKREFLEELNVSVECDRLLCTGENFFEYRGEPHHEIGLYFAVTLPSMCELLNHRRGHLGTEGDRKLEFKWFPLADLRNIDMRPAALLAAFTEGSFPQHFVQRRDHRTVNANANPAPVRAFELHRSIDGLVYVFRRVEGQGDAERFARLDRGNLCIEYDRELGWISRDPESQEVTGRPWNDQDRHNPRQPAQGEWVSKKGAKSYVYELRYIE